MRKVLLVIFIIVAVSNYLSGQEITNSELNNYKAAKIMLTSGEILKCKDLILTDSDVSFTSGNPSLNKSMALEEIEEISIPTKTNTGTGFILGALAGGAIMLIYESIYEKPETTTKEWRTYETWGYIDHSMEVTEEKEMAIGPKIGIVAGGVLIGTLIGASIKSGWKNIYPKKDDNFSFNVSCNSYATKLNLEFNF